MDVCFLFLPFSARGSPCAESGPKCALHYFRSHLEQHFRDTGVNAVVKIVPYDESSVDNYLDKVRDLLSAIFNEFELIIVFGGNHLSIFPLYRYLLEKPNNLVISLDAHRDIYETNDRLTHGSFIRYIKTHCQSILVNYGYRDYSNSVDDQSFYYQTFSVFEYSEFTGFLNNLDLDRFDNIYLDIDVDVFDPSFFPYSPTNMSMGITLEVTQKFFSYLSKCSPKILSFSEYSPLLDKQNTGISFLYKIVEFMISRNKALNASRSIKPNKVN